MNSKHILRVGLGTVLTLALAPSAFATGTDAGTNITNTASVDYTVGGVNQPDETSTTDDFEVDRRILFTVTTTDGNELVTPGASNQALTYRIQNDTNGTVDFYLSVTQDGTDDFDGSGTVEFYLDDGDGVFDGGDTLITYLDNVPEYDGTAATQRVVHVVYDIPTGLANGDLANVTLTAQATPDGSVAATPYTETATDTAGTVDTVLGDAAGDTDATRDGRHSDTDTYEVQTATITVSKTSRVISDPFNNTTNPKRIPGATIQYCITVQNGGSAAADAVVITDAIPTGTTYVAGSIRSNVSGTGTACDATDTTGAAEDDDALNADETNPAGGSFSANTVTVQLEPSIAGSGGISRASFRVTID
ncbi:MAG: hypothetical protein ACOY3X_11970 [Pseudomonadota bacterium]